MPTVDSQSESFGSGPRIRRGRLDSLCLYEITEAELETLANGSSDSLLLNFAIFFLSTGISLWTAIAATKIESDRTFTVFVVCTVVGVAAGVVLLGLWLKFRVGVSRIVRRIKERLPSEDPRPPSPDPQATGP